MKNYPFDFFDIIESAHDIIVVTKPGQEDLTAQEIIYVNAEFTRVTGYKSKEVIGRRAKFLELLEDKNQEPEIIKKLSQMEALETILLSHNKNHEELILNLKMIPLKNNEGVYEYYASIERDITKERKIIHDLHTQSKTDSLTGVSNRRGLNEFSSQVITRAERENSIFYVLMMDLDFFKKVNDKYGHDTGDKLLIAVADDIKKNLRPYDFVARTGGEEFCLILSTSDHDDALHFAERIRESISELSISKAGKKISVTISVGLARYQMGEIYFDGLWQRADKALYHAKNNGRNCVISYDDTLLPLMR